MADFGSGDTHDSVRLHPGPFDAPRCGVLRPDQTPCQGFEVRLVTLLSFHFCHLRPFHLEDLCLEELACLFVGEPLKHTCVQLA